jgi:hypothetical protein
MLTLIFDNNFHSLHTGHVDLHNGYIDFEQWLG